MGTISVQATLPASSWRWETAQRRLAEACEKIIENDDPWVMIETVETMAAAIGHDHPLLSARVFACAATARVVERVPNTEGVEPEIERLLSDIRPVADPVEWEAAWELGTSENIVDLFRELAALPVPGESAP